MRMMCIAVSTLTESGDRDVFCIDFMEPTDVATSIEDMMGRDLAYVSEFQAHCPWGIDIEDCVLTELKAARDSLRLLIEGD